MENETITVINRLADIVGKSSEYIINEYTIWYLASAIGYILFGIIIIFLSIRFCKIPEEYDEDCEWVFPLIKWIVIGAGCIFIVCNIGDLFSPTAVGIHRLILDIRG